MWIILKGQVGGKEIQALHTKRKGLLLVKHVLLEGVFLHQRSLVRQCSIVSRDLWRHWLSLLESPVAAGP